MACEKLAGIEVPKRGEYCRVIAAELNRIASHLLSVGTMGMDIGAFTPFTHAIREREYINDLLEELCGARLTYNYMRIGGVAWDLPPGFDKRARAFLDRFEPLDRRVQRAHLRTTRSTSSGSPTSPSISPEGRSTTTSSARTCAARA